MSNFMDLLRKLGIFRSGSVSGTYTNATNRPTELQMEGVYDAKKDLVNKDDVVRAKSVIAGGARGGLMAKLLLLIAVIVGLIFMLGIFSGGFTIWAIIMIAIWLFVIWKFWRSVSVGGQGLIGMIILLIVTIIVSFIVFGIANPSASTDSSGNSTGTLTDANFDKKVLAISSPDGSVAGTIGLTKKTNKVGKKYLSAAYNILIKTDLPLNSKCGTPGFIMGSSCTKGYEYSGRLVPVQEVSPKTSNGSVSAVYCSDYELPEPYSISGTGKTMMGCVTGSTDNIQVGTFATNFQTNYYSYAEILKTTNFELYDRSNFWEPTKGEAGSFTGNDDRAVQETSPVKTLQFVVSE